MERFRMALGGAALIGAVALGAGCQKSEPAAAPMPHGAQVTPPAQAGGLPTSFSAAPPVGTKARCPVSGEDFVVSAETLTSTHEGRVYAFCCGDCKPTFEKNPAKYASK
jgi:YHS domain-containing protein